MVSDFSSISLRLSVVFIAEWVVVIKPNFETEVKEKDEEDYLYGVDSPFQRFMV